MQHSLQIIGVEICRPNLGNKILYLNQRHHRIAAHQSFNSKAIDTDGGPGPFAQPKIFGHLHTFVVTII